jgi:UDP-N-acetylglucosamine diphosphorylase / glucose-1-phosphate thymidylyltransferase / UDP-N-acetylgalactosamine diphosphorylase / glucosamine-1-phosphate N-acetyltransferase / galactosamine-1-phosphate N-acetyltransferase
MPSTPIVLFHDSRGQLAPLTDLRSSFDVRTGALTLRERLSGASFTPMGEASTGIGPVLSVFVPASHEPLYRESMYHHREPAILVNEVPRGTASVLLINGRAPLPPVKELAVLPIGHGFREADDAGPESFIAAHVEPAMIPRVLGGDLSSLTLLPPPANANGRHLLSRPWHVRTFRDACLAHDLKAIRTTMGVRLPFHATVITGHHEVLNFGTIEPGVVLDCSHGDIVVMQGAVVRPGAILIGPCYVGPGSTVLERATIRPGTAIGPTCKVNGEVGGSIFQGYSNKAHDGYLGDSYVGEWVNFGAGTTNSNLLNTYAEIIAKASPDSRNERTGETFLGAIIGDHCKFAICTRIMTGSVLHTGSMFATTAPVSGCVPSFTWATDATNPDREEGVRSTSSATATRTYRLDKFIDVMKAAMQRRKIEPSAGYVKVLGALHAARK